MDCQVRIPGICNFDPATTVLAHLPGGGMGTKQHDIHGAYCCSACHDQVDGRSALQYDSWEIREWFVDGVFRTQLLLLEQGLLIVK